MRELDRTHERQKSRLLPRVKRGTGPDFRGGLPDANGRA